MKYKKYMILFGIMLLLFKTNVYAIETTNTYENKYSLTYNETKNNVITIDKKYSITGNKPSTSKLSCGQLIDSSTQKLLNDFLKYPRYAVPAILIVLGSLDFFKAVVAGKEDEMKKAQKTFIKRVIIGVAVFLVPLLVNVIIWFANVAWEGLGYTTCNF